MAKSQANRSFASDNNAGVHPKVMAAIARANAGHVIPTRHLRFRSFETY
jgi:hypothetical protein